MGDAVSPDGAVELCWGLEVGGAPFEVAGVDDRWVMGLVPWVHAFWAGGFLLRSAMSAMRSSMDEWERP